MFFERKQDYRMNNKDVRLSGDRCALEWRQMSCPPVECVSDENSNDIKTGGVYWILTRMNEREDMEERKVTN